MRRPVVGTTINRGAYQQLIDENIEWLLEQPRSLERDHIEGIIKHSVDIYYPKKRLYTEEQVIQKLIDHNFLYINAGYGHKRDGSFNSVKAVKELL